MSIQEYVIREIRPESVESFQLRLQPAADTIPKFRAGQYCHLYNPAFSDPVEPHPFSIASSPYTQEHLEFCIKVCGDWTEQLSKAKAGDVLKATPPEGSFTLGSEKYRVFMAGGLGIAPIMSMLRTLSIDEPESATTLLYGNRTPETVMYKRELEMLQQVMPNLKISHIFSELSASDPWPGARGFITTDFITQEVRLSEQPTFYVIGPMPFISAMTENLHVLGVNDNHIKLEKLS